MLISATNTAHEAEVTTQRRLLELIADGERESGFTAMRAEGTRRLYAVDATPLRDVDEWLARFRSFWAPPLAALATELAQGTRQRKVGEALTWM